MFRQMHLLKHIGCRPEQQNLLLFANQQLLPWTKTRSGNILIYNDGLISSEST
jgi:hypothetical protein